MVDEENDPLTESKPLAFSVSKEDASKKDEKALREEEKRAFQESFGDTGVKPPLPDAIKLAHPKPPFVEAVESMFQAVVQFLKEKINPESKDGGKNKPS